MSWGKVERRARPLAATPNPNSVNLTARKELCNDREGYVNARIEGKEEMD